MGNKQKSFVTTPNRACRGYSYEHIGVDEKIAGRVAREQKVYLIESLKGHLIKRSVKVHPAPAAAIYCNVTWMGYTNRGSVRDIFITVKARHGKLLDAHSHVRPYHLWLRVVLSKCRRRRQSILLSVHRVRRLCCLLNVFCIHQERVSDMTRLTLRASSAAALVYPINYAKLISDEWRVCLGLKLMTPLQASNRAWLCGDKYSHDSTLCKRLTRQLWLKKL